MHDIDDSAVQRYLRGLPLALPRPDLGARILAQHRRRRQTRRLIPFAAAAILALAAALPVWRDAPPAADVDLAKTVPDPVLVAELRALDRRLQSSYLLADADQQRALLWQMRAQAEDRLNSGAPAPRLIQL